MLPNMKDYEDRGVTITYLLRNYHQLQVVFIDPSQKELPPGRFRFSFVIREHVFGEAAEGCRLGDHWHPFFSVAIIRPAARF